MVDGCTNGTGGSDGGALLIVGGVVLRCVALMMGFAVTTRDLLRRALTARAPSRGWLRCNFCLIAVEPIASVAASVVFGLGMDQLNCLKFATIKYLYKLDRREGCHEDVRRSLSRGKSVEYEREWQT